MTKVKYVAQVRLYSAEGYLIAAARPRSVRRVHRVGGGAGVHMEVLLPIENACDVTDGHIEIRGSVGRVVATQRTKDLQPAIGELVAGKPVELGVQLLVEGDGADPVIRELMSVEVDTDERTRLMQEIDDEAAKAKQELEQAIARL